ncbi:MAG TPA: lysylphosphatidylglycerol synthase transmembrane domain-containing protein [Gemmatimonadales bacterium]|nr:lysylphosphatidylglycerol synthase transmembrane domain-containing protein [Gemmatimonadales bacterium]
MTQPERGATRVLLLLIGVAVTAALIWFVFRSYDVGQVWTTIRTVRIAPLVVAVILATLPFLLRVPRWQLLLLRDDGSRLPATALWHAIATGFAANNLLPYRAGELVRVAAVTRLADVSFATALSSVAVERVLDALTVVGMLSVALVMVPQSASAASSNGIAAHANQVGIGCLVALGLAVIASRFPDHAIRTLQRLLPRGAVSDAITGFLSRLLAGLGALRDPRHAAPVLAWTLVIWLVNASAFYVALIAFNIGLSFWGALIVQGIVAIGIVGGLTPGNVGIFEAAIVGALALLGVDGERAFAYALTYHITTFIPIAILGGWSAVRTGIGLRVKPPVAA